MDTHVINERKRERDNARFFSGEKYLLCTKRRKKVEKEGGGSEEGKRGRDKREGDTSGKGVPTTYEIG